MCALLSNFPTHWERHIFLTKLIKLAVFKHAYLYFFFKKTVRSTASIQSIYLCLLKCYHVCFPRKPRPQRVWVHLECRPRVVNIRLCYILLVLTNIQFMLVQNLCITCHTCWRWFKTIILKRLFKPILIIMHLHCLLTLVQSKNCHTHHWTLIQLLIGPNILSLTLTIVVPS